MPNYFDQFDAPNSFGNVIGHADSVAAAKPKGNFFDQFDGAPAAPESHSAIGEVLKSFVQPSAEAGRSILTGLGGSVAMGMDAIANIGHRHRGEPESTGFQDNAFKAADDLGGRAVEYWRPDVTHLGTGARVASGAANVLGSLPQILGMPEVFLGNAGMSPAIDAVNQGKDTRTALELGGMNLGLNAAGFKLPASALGALRAAGVPVAKGATELGTRLATGAVINPALGVAGGYGDKAILSHNGYEADAAAINPVDPVSMATQALLGAAFAGHEHMASRGDVPHSSDIDPATLAAGNATLGDHPAPVNPVDARKARTEAAMQRNGMVPPTDLGALLHTLPPEIAQALGDITHPSAEPVDPNAAFRRPLPAPADTSPLRGGSSSEPPSGQGFSADQAAATMRQSSMEQAAQVRPVEPVAPADPVQPVATNSVAKAAPKDGAAPMTVLRVLAKQGLNREAWKSEGVDPAQFTDRAGFHYVFRKKGGLTPDGAREVLQQEGFLPADHPDLPPSVDDNAAVDLVMRALSGETIHSMHDSQAAAEAQHQAHADREQAQFEWDNRVGTARPDVAPEDYHGVDAVAAIAERAKAAGIDEFDIAPFSDEADADYIARLQREITQHEARHGTEHRSDQVGDTAGVRGQADLAAQGAATAQRSAGQIAGSAANAQADGLSGAKSPAEPAAGVVGAIRKLVRTAVDRASDRATRKGEWTNVGVVSAEKAARIKELSPSADVAGFRHVVEEDAIRKVLADHGTEKERAHGQIPITEADFEKIPEILARGEIDSIGVTHTGLKGIVTVARLGDDFVYVEEVRTGREALALKTMWKRPARSASAETASEPSPEALAGPPPQGQSPDGADGVSLPPEANKDASVKASTPTGIKNAKVTEERALRGKDELDYDNKRDNPTVALEASQRLKDDPEYAMNLAEAIGRNPRPLTAEEGVALTMDRKRIVDARDQAEDDLADAIRAGNDAKIAGAQRNFQLLDSALETNDQASKAAGYENSRGLSARKMMSDQEYDEKRIINRATALAGKRVKPEALAGVLEDAKRIRNMDRRLGEAQKAARASRDKPAPAVVKAKAMDSFQRRVAELHRMSMKDQLVPGCEA